MALVIIKRKAEEKPLDDVQKCDKFLKEMRSRCRVMCSCGGQTPFLPATIFHNEECPYREMAEGAWTATFPEPEEENGGLFGVAGEKVGSACEVPVQAHAAQSGSATPSCS